MDESLYPALKAGILAETDPEFVEYREAGSTGQMAIWLNKPHATVKAWNKDAKWSAVFNSIDASKYTPGVINVNAATDATATKQLLVTLVKLTVQQNMLLAFGQTIDARDSGNVDGVLDTVAGIYTLNGTATNSPGGSGGVLAAQQLVRPALRGEAIFGGTDMTKATTVTAKILAYEGQVSDNDVVQAVNLP